MELTGTTLDGTYEILELLAHGSTSVVYKARHRLMDRLVAIKMLAGAGAADDSLTDRLGQACRAVSLLHHESIVAIHDFGLSAGGQPYLVLEYVEGESLAAVLDRQGRLSVDEFVGVFPRVCAALSCAHAGKVVHRALSPAKIIVGDLSAESPLVKVLFSSIARNVPPDATGGSGLGTGGGNGCAPLYMSPEQSMGRPVDGRSDIYSLGCIMYRSLTGATPFAGDSALDIASRHLSEPVPPFATGRPAAAGAPADLERAVLRCLEKDPARRWQSVAELGNAITGARVPAGSGNKAGQTAPPLPMPAGFTRLHKSMGSLTATSRAVLSVVATLLLIATVFAAWASSSGWQTIITESKLRWEIFRLAYGDPRLLPLQQTLGDSYFKSGKIPEAKAQYEQALQQALKLPVGSDDLQLTRIFVKLAQCYSKMPRGPETDGFLKTFYDAFTPRLVRCDQTGRWSEKNSLLAERLRLEQLLLPAGSEREMETLLGMAECCKQMNNPGRALALIERCKALALAGERSPNKEQEYIWALNSEADAYKRQQQYLPALRAWAEAARRQERISAPTNSAAIYFRRAICTCCYELRDLARAETIARQIIAVDQRAEPPNPHLWEDEGMLVVILLDRGKDGEATALCDSFGAAAVGQGEASKWLALQGQITQHCVIDHRYAQAELIQKKALEVALRHGGISDKVSALQCMGEVYADEHKYPQAIASFRKIVQIIPAGSMHAARSSALCAMGNTFSAGGRFAEARKSYELALSEQKTLRKPSDPAVAGICANLRIVCQQLGDEQAADSYLQQAVRIWAENGDAGSITTNLRATEQALKAQRKSALAENMLREAGATARQHGRDPLCTAAALWELAMLYQEDNRHAEARRTLEEVLEIRRANLRPADPAVAGTYHALAMSSVAMGDAKAFEQYVRQTAAAHEQSGNWLLAAQDCQAGGELLVTAGKLPEGAQMFREGLACLQRAASDRATAFTTACLLRDLGYVNSKQGKFTEASQHYLQALHLLKSSGYQKKLEYGWTLMLIGSDYLTQGDKEKARAWLSRAGDALMSMDTPPDANWLSQMGRTAGELEQAGAYSQCERLLTQVLPLVNKPDCPDQALRRSVLDVYSRLLADTGRNSEAQRVKGTLQTLGPQQAAAAR